MYLTSIATVFRLPANYESLTRGPTVCGSRPDPSGIRPDGCGRALWRRARAREREREREREMKVKLTFASGPRCRRNGARKITKMKMEEEERKEKVLRRPFAGVAVLAVTEFSNQLGHTVDRFYWALFFCLVLKRTFNFCFHTTIAKFYRLLPGFAGFFFLTWPSDTGLLLCFYFVCFFLVVSCFFLGGPCRARCYLRPWCDGGVLWTVRRRNGAERVQFRFSDRAISVDPTLGR